MTSSRPAALIVEDQPFVGMVASDILRESGYDTFHAFDAQAAAAMLDEHPEIGVVVTEAKLPGDVNGLECAGACRPSGPTFSWWSRPKTILRQATFQAARASFASPMRAASSRRWLPPRRFSPTPELYRYSANSLIRRR
jgi:CheY-like chemotaxis protein